MFGTTQVYKSIFSTVNFNLNTDYVFFCENLVPKLRCAINVKVTLDFKS